MRSSWIGIGMFAALTAAVGCHNSSPQTDQTQTTGATAPNANDPANGNGPAAPQGDQATTPGNGANGAAMMDNGKDPRPAIGSQNLGANGGVGNTNAKNPNLDRTGDSFESSGGSSGLGARPDRKVPGQNLFRVEGKADGGR